MSHVRYHPHAHVPPTHDFDSVRSPVGEQSGTPFNDSEELKLDIFTHIAEIEVSYEDSRVCGLKVKYQPLSGQEVTAVHTTRSNVPTAVLTLGKEEFITEISGLLNGGVASLKLQTNNGRSIEVGGKEGTPFSLNIPSAFCVKSFSGSFGDSLHSIGAILRPTIMRRSVEDLLPGPSKQAEHLGFADVFPRFPKSTGIRRISLKFNEKGIKSLDVNYWPDTLGGKAAEQLETEEGFITDIFDFSVGEALVRVHGTINDGLVTSLGFETTKGRKRSWGTPSGTAFNDSVQPGHRTTGLIAYSDSTGLKGVKLDVDYPLPSTVLWLRG